LRKEVMSVFFDDFFDDFGDLEDFAIIGGAIGYIEEEAEERERKRREEENDPLDPPDEDPWP
jgi:hypothetical protein